MTQKNNEQQPLAWHAMDTEKVIGRLDADADKGLTASEAKRRLQEYGPNELPKTRRRSAWMRLLMQFHNVLIYVLIAAAVITALMDHWIDTWVILAVVLINALIGFIQEGKAEKALESIRKMLSLDAIVMRDGEKLSIPAEDLVPGDLVMLKSGDKIPADIRLVMTRDFRVEESPLTGESTAVEKQTAVVDARSVVGDRANMAFSGTVVVYGKATGVVTATGMQTELGKINQMMAAVEKITTPLLEQIESFGKWLSLFILGITALFFAFGYFLRDYELAELFLAVIGLVVASIPEGLPAIMTITLAIGVQRMAARNAIIRRLPSVETLGAVDVICSDKTGTLTRNEMTARTVTTAGKSFTVEGSGFQPEGDIQHKGKAIDPEQDQALWALLQTIRCSNNASISKDAGGQWGLTGTPTEGALLALAMKAGLSGFKPERLDTIPFESDHKYMATLNRVNGDRFVYMTGAPERVLDMCHSQLGDEGEQALDQAYWEEKMHEAAAKGQRLLGAAYAATDRKELRREDLEKKKVFLGIIGILDPPRPEAVDAIQECKEAGVQVKMITGDHAETAKAIGLEIGIGDGKKAVTGQELEDMSDEQLREVVQTHDVYARTSPEHKLRLVSALQENGRLCAMTGDGVNDAPALKKANIGIAMGIKGTEVSKDAAEMVLADDNFASIVHAIEEGRTVYDNIRKAMLFILPTNGAEALVLMSAILLGIVMPITPAQILWVNMVTAVTLALALSFEPMEEKVMERPPRKSKEPILDKKFIWRIAFVSLLIGGLTLGSYFLAKSWGMDIPSARTIAVNTLVAGQLFYLFNCRKINSVVVGKGFFANPYVFYAAGGLILLQALFSYAPFMHTLFDTAPLQAIYWLVPLASGLVVFFLVELEKRLFHIRKK